MTPHSKIRHIETLGRAAVAALFVLGGINKLLNYSSTLERMGEVGLSPAELLLPLTIGLELMGGLGLLVGTRAIRTTAGFTLAGFTLLTNVYFHRFWEMSGPFAQLELSLFFKNIAIAGALLMMAASARLPSPDET